VTEKICCVELQHINYCTRDFEAGIEHFQRLFGAQFVLDMPAPQWHAVLLHMGGVLFEMFVPEHWLVNARYGAHWIGLEYKTDEVAETRRNLQERGLGLVRDIGIAIHSEPEECFGVAFEFYDLSFFSDDPVTWIEPLKPASYWRDEHPIGYTGLARYSIAVGDHEAALHFYDDLFDLKVAYEQQRPAIGARVTGIRLADTVVELLSPTGPGPIADQLHRYGDGMRSVAFGVADLDRTAAHFADRGITLVPGDRDDTLAIRPVDNCGLMMEFSAEAAR
jgi:catechol 2,3-dioxygenase-like lactoylglutathione lyase family enzyme